MRQLLCYSVAIQEEVIQLSQEITRIACKTTYAGKQCIAGVTGKDKGGVLNSNGDIEFQVGAYANDTLKLSMKNGFTLSGICMDVKKDGAAAPIKVTDTDADNNANGMYLLDGFYTFSVHSASSAQKTIATIDSMINVVDSHRAALGALQNRMESTIRNQENVAENVSDARSRIRDADYSEEASNLTAQNIVQQAATTILTQANQRPQIATSLLGG